MQELNEIVSSLKMADMGPRLKDRQTGYFILHRATGSVHDSIPYLANFRGMEGIHVRPGAVATLPLYWSGILVRVRYWCPERGEREVAQRLARARDKRDFIRTFFRSWLEEHAAEADLSGGVSPSSQLSRRLAEAGRRFLGLETELVIDFPRAASEEDMPAAERPRQRTEAPRVERDPAPASSGPAPSAPSAPAEVPRETFRDPAGRPAASQGERTRTNQISIHIPSLSVRTNDSDLSRHLLIDAEIEGPPAGLFGGNRTSESALRELLVREVRYYCMDRVGFHQLHFDLRTAVRLELAKHISHELQKNGIGILHSLSLGFAESDPSPVSLHKHEHHEIEVHLSLPRERDTPIVVKHRLELELNNLGRFVLSGICDLKVWLNEHLSAATRSVLFDMNYSEIVGEFLRDDHRPLARIRERVADHLDAAGFKIQHMVLIPDLPPLFWRGGVDLGAKGEKFLTEDRRVSFELELKASGVIPDPFDSRLAAYIKPESAKNFDSLVRSKLVEQLQLQFDRIKPEEVYMRFDGVRERLTELVEKILVEKFAFRDPIVSLLPLESELTRLVDALCQEIFKAEIEVASLGEGAQSAPVRIIVSFEILGVDEKGWSTFKIRNLTGAEPAKRKIKEYFEDALKASFKTLPSHRVRYSDARARRELRALVEPAVLQVCNVFGLRLNVSSIDREFANTEKPRLDFEVSRLEAERAALIAEKEKRFEALPIADDEELRKYEVEISVLSNRIGLLLAQIDGERKAALAERRSGLPMSSLDFLLDRDEASKEELP